MDAAPAPAVTEQITVVGRKPPASGGFRELLSELNPLQYLPVVGTIYRAVTGDTIPETARTVGSLVVSGLTGGPVGVGLSLAAMAVERVLGIDPERLGRRLLADVGVAGAAPAPTPVPGPPTRAVPAPPPPSKPQPWSARTLAAYGVRPGADHCADALNGLELRRLHAVA